MAKWTRAFDGNGNILDARVDMEQATTFSVASAGNPPDIPYVYWVVMSPAVHTGGAISPRYNTKEEAVVEMERLMLYGGRRD